MAVGWVSPGVGQRRAVHARWLTPACPTPPLAPGLCPSFLNWRFCSLFYPSKTHCLESLSLFLHPQVWASKWNDRAWLSRRTQGVPDKGERPSPLVRRACMAWPPPWASRVFVAALVPAAGAGLHACCASRQSSFCCLPLCSPSSRVPTRCLPAPCPPSRVQICIWRCCCSRWCSLLIRDFALPCTFTRADLYMAVLLQQVVPAQYAFVLHTADPLTGTRCCRGGAAGGRGAGSYVRVWGARHTGGQESAVMSRRPAVGWPLPSRHLFPRQPTPTVLPSFAGKKGVLHGELVVGMGEALVGNYPGRALSFAAAAGEAPRLLSLPSKREGLFADGGAPHLIARSDSNGGLPATLCCAALGCLVSHCCRPEDACCGEGGREPSGGEENMGRDRSEVVVHACNAPVPCVQARIWRRLPAPACTTRCPSQVGEPGWRMQEQRCARGASARRALHSTTPRLRKAARGALDATAAQRCKGGKEAVALKMMPTG